MISWGPLCSGGVGGVCARMVVVADRVRTAVPITSDLSTLFRNVLLRW